MISVKLFCYVSQKKSLYGDQLCTQTLTHIRETDTSENKMYFYHVYYFIFLSNVFNSFLKVYELDLII